MSLTPDSAAAGLSSEARPAGGGSRARVGHASARAEADLLLVRRAVPSAVCPGPVWPATPDPPSDWKVTVKIFSGKSGTHQLVLS